MKKLAFCLCLLLAACSSADSDEQRRLDDLRHRWGDTYDFSFKQRLYLEVRQKKTGPVAADEIISIYKAFCSEGKTAPSFVYLNVFDEQRHPLWQVYVKDGEFVTNKVTYY